MADAPVLLVDEPAPGVRRLTLNRPAKRNAIDRALFAALIAELEALDDAAGVGAVVLTGAGSAFCAGVDLGDVADSRLLEERRRTGISPPGVLLGVQTPVIAAVNGACVAGGLELALACDLIIASSEARFADTHLRLGLLPSWGGAALLPAAVGVRRAKELSLTGRFATAAQASEYGLVASVVAPEELLGVALTLAGEIAAAPRETARNLLQIYDAGEGLGRDARLALERQVLLSSGPAPGRGAGRQASSSFR